MKTRTDFNYISMTPSPIKRDGSITEYSSYTHNQDYKEAFIKYASLRLDSSIVNSDISVIENILDLYIRAYIRDDFEGLFRTIDLETLERIRVELSIDNCFVELDDENRRTYSSAFNKYYSFAKWFNEQMAEGRLQEEFKNYLESKGINNSSARRYVLLLDKDVSKIVQQQYDTTVVSIFDIKNPIVCQEIYESLKVAKEYSDINKASNGAADAALRKYHAFLTERRFPHRKTQTGIVINPYNYNKESGDEQVADIESHLNDMSRLFTLLKKNNLPIKPQLKERFELLREREKAIVENDLIISPIQEQLNAYGLSSIITFKYSGDFEDVEVLDPVITSSIRQDLEDLEQIVYLMEKHSLPIPDEVRLSRMSTIKEYSLKETIRTFEDWLVEHIAYLKQTRIRVKTIYYSPSSSFMVDLKWMNEDSTIND